MMEDTRQRWIVLVDDEVRFTTETSNREEAETWADHHLDTDTKYEIMSTTPEVEDFIAPYY